MAVAQLRHGGRTITLAAMTCLSISCAGSRSGPAPSAPMRPPETSSTTTVPASTTSSTLSAGTTTAAGTTTVVTALSAPSADPLVITVGPAVAVTTTTIDGVLRTPDGRDRTYHVHLPPRLAAGVPIPLLVALHGGTGWGTQFERNSGFDGLAEANGFIVVYPDGIGVGADGTALRTWNGGGCCGPAMTQQVDDVEFIRALVEDLKARYDIDPHRVFAAGHSNGGILAYRLACELADQIVAIGVQSSSLEVAECAPSQPVSVLHIHGSADQNLPIAGGRGPNGISGVSFNPPFDGVIALAAADACAAEPSRSTDRSNSDLAVAVFAPCANGTQVVFVEVAGASHAWMGHATGSSGAGGVPYANLDSSLLIWNFLSGHPRP